MGTLERPPGRAQSVVKEERPMVDLLKQRMNKHTEWKVKGTSGPMAFRKE